MKNGGLDQHGAEPFEHQQFRTADIEGGKAIFQSCRIRIFYRYFKFSHMFVSFHIFCKIRSLKRRLDYVLCMSLYGSFFTRDKLRISHTELPVS